jgi:hypothetical protein
VQEALEKLGFYSGEEDTEFSSFSTGTERAVKTWQVNASHHDFHSSIERACLFYCFHIFSKKLYIAYFLVQASIGTAEDGLMTSELLERLFTGHIGEEMEKVEV